MGIVETSPFSLLPLAFGLQRVGTAKLAVTREVCGAKVGGIRNLEMVFGPKAQPWETVKLAGIRPKGIGPKVGGPSRGPETAKLGVFWKASGGCQLARH